MSVHPTAIIDPEADIDPAAEIGPYCVIRGDVKIGARTRLLAHVYLEGRLTIGQENTFYPFSSCGVTPQDRKYKGEASETRIGKRNKIREFVTIHRGTAGGGMLTRVGDDCLIMAQAHIAHDCLIGDGVIMANAATLAGHVRIEDRANIGAYSGVHQFCRVGKEAYVGGYSVVVKDALPFALTVGNHAKCYGLNITGMKRRGHSRATIDALHHAFHLLLSAKLNTTQAVERIKQEITGSSEVSDLLHFIETSQRGVTK